MKVQMAEAAVQMVEAAAQVVVAAAVQMVVAAAVQMVVAAVHGNVFAATLQKGPITRGGCCLNKTHLASACTSVASMTVQTGIDGKQPSAILLSCGNAQLQATLA